MSSLRNDALELAWRLEDECTSFAACNDEWIAGGRRYDDV